MNTAPHRRPVGALAWDLRQPLSPAGRAGDPRALRLQATPRGGRSTAGPPDEAHLQSLATETLRPRRSPRGSAYPRGSQATDLRGGRATPPARSEPAGAPGGSGARIGVPRGGGLCAAALGAARLGGLRSARGWRRKGGFETRGQGGRGVLAPQEQSRPRPGGQRAGGSAQRPWASRPSVAPRRAERPARPRPPGVGGGGSRDGVRPRSRPSGEWLRPRARPWPAGVAAAAAARAT